MEKNVTAFLKEFDSHSKKMGDVLLSNTEPEFFIDTGNYCLNKIISDNYLNGYAQGRLAGIAGPSGAGKSFLIGNAIKAAQDANMGIFVLDSEHALDESYLNKLGVDIDNPMFLYRGIKSISQGIDLFSNFTKMFRNNKVNERFLFVLDSLDMLMTDSEITKYDKKGEIGGDQGQQAKQLKRMLATIMHDIKQLPVAGLMSKQVYKNQDPIMSKQEPYIFTDALKFAFSQILQVNRLLLKDDATKTFEGITLKAYGYKTRFAKPYQQIKIEVPYDEGMDKYSGILDAAVHFDIIQKNGGWYNFNGEKFQKNNFNEYRDDILAKIIETDGKLDVSITEEDYHDSENRSRKKSLEDRLKEVVGEE